jgi:hypothetical protein
VRSERQPWSPNRRPLVTTNFGDFDNAKAVEFGLSALGRSFFDGGAPAETRAHRSDDQYQRIRLRQPLYPAITCSTPMPSMRLWDSLLLTEPSTFVSGTFPFNGICRKKERADEQTQTADLISSYEFA